MIKQVEIKTHAQVLPVKNREKKNRSHIKWNRVIVAITAIIFIVLFTYILCVSHKKATSVNTKSSITTNSKSLNEHEVNAPNTDSVLTQLYSDNDVKLLAKTVYGEAHTTGSDTQMSAVVWCVLNRVDENGYGFGGSIEHVVMFPNQFTGYNENNPVDEHIEWLVKDVLDRWIAEKTGRIDVGRTLPKDYLWFTGDGNENLFRNDYNIVNADIWDWAADSPYDN